FVRRYAAWETRPRSSFLPNTFRVEIGDVTKPTRLLGGDETSIKHSRIIDVPMDYREEFERDPEGCARDYAGKATLTVHPFIGRRELIADMFAKGEQSGLKHCFSKLDVTLQNESDTLLSENLHWITETKN